ncbi:hypothetical protein AADZ91_11725 [Colwelliaceae bacterium 6441]
MSDKRSAGEHEKMLNIFFKCLLFCSGVLSLNSALALPLADTLNVSTSIETLQGNPKSALSINDTAFDITFVVSHHHKHCLLNVITQSKHQKALTKIAQYHLTRQHDIAKNVEYTLRQKYFFSTQSHHITPYIHYA